MDLRKQVLAEMAPPLGELYPVILTGSPASGPQPLPSQPPPHSERQAAPGGQGSSSFPAIRTSKGEAGQGAGPARLCGGVPPPAWRLPSASPLGQPFLSPVPRSHGWHLTFWGPEGRPLRWSPLGVGQPHHHQRHRGSLGESWPPGGRVHRGPRLCAWHWAKRLCALSHLILNCPSR